MSRASEPLLIGLKVSNICDVAYLGTPRTICSLSPLLEKRSINPHATIITLFMSAVLEVKKMLEATDPTFRSTYEREGTLRLFQHPTMIWLFQWPALGATVGFEALYHVMNYEPLFKK